MYVCTVSRWNAKCRWSIDLCTLGRRIHQVDADRNWTRPLVRACMSVSVWRCVLYVWIGWVLQLIKENTDIVTHYYIMLGRAHVSDSSNHDKTISGQQLIS